MRYFSLYATKKKLSIKKSPREGLKSFGRFAGLDFTQSFVYNDV